MFQPIIHREGNSVKFSNCPKEFEIDINLLRKKIRKFPEIIIPEGQQKEFVEFYRNLINEKDEKYVELGFEILKFVRTRSVRFIPPISEKDYNFGKLSFMKYCIRNYLGISGGQSFSFFCSTYHVKHTYNGASLDTRNELNEPYAIDMVIDQDPPNAWEKTEKIIHYLEKRTPLSVVFSGRGFHIWITYDNLIECFNFKKQEVYKHEEIKEIYKKIEDDIMKNTKIKEIGHGGREKQFIRVPYTLNERSNLICLPLDEKQFYDFKEEIAKIENVLKMDIRNRGMPIW